MCTIVLMKAKGTDFSYIRCSLRCVGWLTGGCCRAIMWLQHWRLREVSISIQHFNSTANEEYVKYPSLEDFGPYGVYTGFCSFSLFRRLNFESHRGRRNANGNNQLQKQSYEDLGRRQISNPLHQGTNLPRQHPYQYQHFSASRSRPRNSTRAALLPWPLLPKLSKLWPLDTSRRRTSSRCSWPQMLSLHCLHWGQDLQMLWEDRPFGLLKRSRHSEKWHWNGWASWGTRTSYMKVRRSVCPHRPSTRKHNKSSCSQWRRSPSCLLHFCPVV